MLSIPTLHYFHAYHLMLVILTTPCYLHTFHHMHSMLIPCYLHICTICFPYPNCTFL